MNGADMWGFNGFGAASDELIPLVDALGLLDMPL